MTPRSLLYVLSVLLVLLGASSGCESTDTAGTASVSGYYGVGFYDPWYYGPYWDDPDVIVTPPPTRPESPPEPAHPIALPPASTPRPTPMPSIPSMTRPAFRR